MTYGTQTANAVALDMGLVPEGKEKDVAKSLALIELEQKQNGHFTSGVHGMKRLFTMLSEYGYEDQVFNMLKKETFPSFKYMLDHDFTTWPESFQDYDANKSNMYAGSHNHPMQSGFAMWFHQNTGGIIQDKPGFEHFKIKPFGYNHLKFANTTYNSIYGDIASNWKVTGTQYTHVVNIPVNTTATVFVPTSNPESVKIIQMNIGSDACVVFKGYKNGFASYMLASGKYEINNSL